MHEYAVAVEILSGSGGSVCGGGRSIVAGDTVFGAAHRDQHSGSRTGADGRQPRGKDLSRGGGRVGHAQPHWQLYRDRAGVAPHLVQAGQGSASRQKQPARAALDRPQPQRLRYTRHQQSSVDRAACFARLYPNAQFRRRRIVRPGGGWRRRGVVRGADGRSRTYIWRANCNAEGSVQRRSRHGRNFWRPVGRISMNESGFLALLLMTATSFPLAFWIARLCLAGVIRVLEHRPERS
jgi:hypothetical protein